MGAGRFQVKYLSVNQFIAVVLPVLGNKFIDAEGTEGSGGDGDSGVARARGNYSP